MGFLADMTASRAMFLHARRKEDRALPLYARAVEKGTTNSGALAAYALLLIRRGEFIRAEQVAQLACDCAKKPREKRDARLNLGLAKWKNGALDEAIAIYEEVLGELENSTLIGTLGFFFIAEGDLCGNYEKALAFNRKAMDYDDEDPVLLDNLGQALLRVGAWEEAETYFARALEKRPEQFDSLVCLAKCKLRAGQRDEARALLEKALARPFSHLNTVDRAEAEAMAETI